MPPPRVIIFDDFLTDEEASNISSFCEEEGWQRSVDAGELKPDGSFEMVTSKSRTSTNCWCSDVNGCYDSPRVRSVIRRIEDATDIPAVNSESLQVLRYEGG